MSGARLNRGSGSGVNHSPASATGSTISLPYSRPPVEAPFIDPAVVAYLQQQFRPQVSPHFDLRNYDRQAGAQEVIAHLLALCETQNNEQR